MKKCKIFIFALSCVMMLPFTTMISDINNEVSISAEETINNMSLEEYNTQVDTMISMVNEYRAENGLPPCKTSPLLMDFAKIRAKEQEITGLSHTRPDNSSWTTIFDEYSVKYSDIRENVGGGSYNLTSVPTVMLDQWKNSEVHNSNILSDCEYIGVGLDYYDGNCYWVQIFCSTTDESITNDAYITTLEPDITTTTVTTTTTTDTTQDIPDENYDINKDGKINTIDLILLKRKLLEIYN